MTVSANFEGSSDWLPYNCMWEEHKGIRAYAKITKIIAKYGKAKNKKDFQRNLSLFMC